MNYGEMTESRHWYGVLPLFDPGEGTTIIEPPGHGKGYWAGAPSVLFDAETQKFYLYYRLRKPRGEGRGYECRIAESGDGVHFTTIWRAIKEELNSPSLERAALVKCLDHRYRLYLSYVDPEDNRWRVDLLEAASPREFDVQRRTKVFGAADIGAEGVKDPVVVIVGRKYYMYLSYAPAVTDAVPELRAKMHATADVYNTGMTKSCTGLATSLDGQSFTWLGPVLTPGDEGWDSYETRLSTLVYTPPVFTAFYDGIPSVEENYEEKTGMAITFDCRTFERVTPAGPLLTSPYGAGSLRYVEGVPVGEDFYFYYEYARPDGAHELRLSVVKR